MSLRRLGLSLLDGSGDLGVGYCPVSVEMGVACWVLGGQDWASCGGQGTWCKLTSIMGLVLTWGCSS
jgi:hypothetical protein